MLRSFVDSMTFHPAAYPDGWWDLADRLGAEDVSLEAVDGVRLHAWRVPAAGEAAAATTLFLHGNAGNLTHRIAHIEAIARAGSDLLILDYRGYGKSEGSPSEEGLYRDAAAAYDWLVESGAPADRIVCHGESLGTAVAADLATRRPCAGVILEAPFPSRAAVAARVLPVLGPLLARGFDTAAKLATIEAPVLVVHGTADGVIPHSLGRETFAAAREPKELWSLPGAGHNDIVERAGAEYGRRLRAFYRGLGAGL